MACFMLFVSYMAKNGGQLECEMRKLRQLAKELDRRGNRFSALLADPRNIAPHILEREAAALRQLAEELSRQCQKVDRLQAATEAEDES